MALNKSVAVNDGALLRSLPTLTSCIPIMPSTAAEHDDSARLHALDEVCLVIYRSFSFVVSRPFSTQKRRVHQKLPQVDPLK